MWIYDLHGRFMIVPFRQNFRRPGVLEMNSVDIQTIDRGDFWYSFLDFHGKERSIHDYRGKEKSYERRKLTKADRSAYTFLPPHFGDVDAFWQRISMYLNNEGFGAFA